MRRPPEGVPYVPPVCPTDKRGDIPNLEAVLFELVLDPGMGRNTDVWGIFKVEDEDGVMDAWVETAIAHLPADSDADQKLRAISRPADDINANWLPSTKSPFAAHVGSIFCERVAHCRGVVDDECWALEQAAVEVVIEQALEDYEEGL